MVISLVMLRCPALLLGPGVNELGDAEQLLCAAGQSGLCVPVGKPQSASGHVKLSLLCMKNPKGYKVIFQSCIFWLLPCSSPGHLLPFTGVNNLMQKQLRELCKKGRFLTYFHVAFLLLQAILLNGGPIEAPFSLVPPTTAMGCCFTFLPQEGIVAPGGLQAIQISFWPTILGEFKEEFSFCGTESPEPLSLTIR